MSHHHASPNPRPRALSRWILSLLVLAALLTTACELTPPVSVSMRESMVGQGQVIRVTNTSEKTLEEIRIRVTDPDSGESREHFAASLGPGALLEVGWLKLEGWQVPEDAEIAVTAKGHAIAAKFE